MKQTVSALLSRMSTLREYLMARLQQLPWEKVAWMKRYNPFRHVKRMDWYIIKKFIGTYVYSIVLIISVSIEKKCCWKKALEEELKERLNGE